MFQIPIPIPIYIPIPTPIPILCTCRAEMIRGRQAVSRFATHETGPMLRNLTLPPPSIQTQHGFSLVNTKYWILLVLDMFFQTFLNFHRRPQPDFDCRDCRTARPVITGTFHRNYSHFHCLSSSLHTNWDTIYWDIYMSAKKTI